ncbi:MAG: excinuclease ABC subunit A [Flavobacteriales bacterium]|nr:excinuclease ABC subunit A [Flavobacteriales bacterium]
MSKNEIIIKGARSNNLKNISISIPKNKIVVISGVSGSGKSTLAYDTIYAEAQRKYIESLSSYARQFLNNHHKPEVDDIKGLSPAIAINQKTNATNSKSTVGSTTEIYYYLTLLYAKIGKTISPISGEEVVKLSFEKFKKEIYQFKKDLKFLICCLIRKDQLNILKREGYNRVVIAEKIYEIDEINEIHNIKDPIHIVVDRLILSRSNDFEYNLYQAYKNCKEINNDSILTYNQKGQLIKEFSHLFSLDNIHFDEPHKDLFNFNNPHGACENCNGHGDLIDIDEDKIIPDKNLSVLEDVIHPWRNGKMSRWKQELKKINFPINKKYSQFNKSEKDVLWKGKNEFKGLNAFFDFLKKKSYKIQYRVMLSRYRSLSICKICHGNRLRKEAQYVKINDKSIEHVINLSMHDLLLFIENINSLNYNEKIINKIKNEIISRIESLIKLGLGYMYLNRKCNSLSGGEQQKINIANSLGSGLIGALYILDEPTMGLHPKDTNKLIDILKQLKKLGNSIIIVEHDRSVIKSADHLIDIGPLAGLYGGKIIYQGAIKNVQHKSSLTLDYINQKIRIPSSINNRTLSNFIKIQGAYEHNLNTIDVEIPINAFTAVVGLSGSGKTTLLKNILLPGIKRKLKDYNFKKPLCQDIQADLSNIENIDYLDQNSMKKSSKSTPITYIQAFDSIRNLYGTQKLTKINNLRPKDFSFNVKGGRCENCKGQGEVTIEMQFMSDIKLKCEVCNGSRYKEEILQVYFNDKNIDDILNLTVEEGYDFFIKNNQTKIAQQIKPLITVGLSYLKIGQPVSTLSSGEIQRLKLGSFLSKKNKKSILIFDEPTKGLHFYDIKILVDALYRLVEIGNTVIVIEHNLDVIKNTDWIIELGPDAGDHGGHVVFSGTPKDLINQSTHTGEVLKKEFN